METESAVKAIAGLRIVIGAAAWLTPRMAAKSFGLKPAENPQAPYLGRLFGARDVALGVGTLQATGESQRQWLQLGVAIDAADAVAAGLVFAPAVAGVALGVAALRGNGTPE